MFVRGSYDTCDTYDIAPVVVIRMSQRLSTLWCPHFLTVVYDREGREPVSLSTGRFKGRSREPLYAVRRCIRFRAAQLGQFQSCSSARPKPPPTLTLSLTLAPTLGGTRGRQGRSRAPPHVLVAFKKKLAGRKGSL